MLFNSFAFFVFLPIVLVGYWWACGRSCKAQNFWLLIASYVFYAWWDWRCLFLIIGVSLINFVAGWIIGESANTFLRKGLLAICCVVCLGLFGVFKYYNFFVDSLISVFGGTKDLALNIILPVGISFFTFQALSYTIDVYRGVLKPTKDMVAMLAFIAFFPQLVAGPIERATNLLPQFLRPRATTADLSKLALRPNMYVIDLFDETADYTETEFVDPTHLNINGAIRFTRQLAPHLRKLPVGL